MSLPSSLPPSPDKRLQHPMFAAPSTSTDPTPTSHHGQTRLAGSREAMDIDTGALHRLGAVNQGVLAGRSNKVADSLHTRSNPSLDNSSSQATPAISTSAATDRDELHFDQPFLAAHTEYRVSQPHPDRDLVEQYGLSGLAKTVARTDPLTGEKINKLRRSYEGQIKAFGLAGRNKAVKWEPKHGLSMLQLAQVPPEDFYNQRVSGKEVQKGLSAATQARLQKALQLEPGLVPRNAEWESVLGHDKTKGAADEPKSKKQDAQKDPYQPNAAKANGYSNGASGAQSQSETARPKRAGKKRRYNDESFEGYGEGYDDDLGEEYSSDEGSRRSTGSKKKRQKSGSYNVPSTMGSYGVGMQPRHNIGRGIGAYGGP